MKIQLQNKNMLPGGTEIYYDGYYATVSFVYEKYMTVCLKSFPRTMTYFSDFDYVDYRDDYHARRQILQQAESIFLYNTQEEVPEDLLEQICRDLVA